ncbi:MAG: metal-dependent transcriptional regulator [Candidatus Omnitrophica bacterium]|nr:metal-dependent transcriptional regulator [Candidatus Omnitrophota bacterium]
MTKKTKQDEYVEELWYMKEDSKNSLDDLKVALKGEFDREMVDELVSEGLADYRESEGTISLTRDGEVSARRLIRAHRLAERLLHDVLGGDFEPGACEFEHIVSSTVVDSICTLLGHPRECPHGMPIPEGECCRRSAMTAVCSIVPVTQLRLGEAARIAYINCRNDQHIHKLEELCIRPGVNVKLHQNYPAYVLECEGASIALDKDVASSICVWKDPGKSTEEKAFDKAAADKKRKVRGFKGLVRSIFNLR